MTIAELPAWAALPVALLLVAGSLLTLIGAYGLLRLPGFQSRIHGPTMGTTLGLACVLAASMLTASAHGQRWIVQEILIAVLMVVTSPVTAMLLMQAGIERKRIMTGANKEPSSRDDDAEE